MFRIVIPNAVLADYHHRLPVGLTLIGRAEECDLRLDDESVSRFHARLEIEASGALRLEDLGSRNGTGVNGEAVTGARSVAPGDELVFGAVRARLEAEVIEAPPAPRQIAASGLPALGGTTAEIPAPEPAELRRPRRLPLIPLALLALLLGLGGGLAILDPFGWRSSPEIAPGESPTTAAAPPSETRAPEVGPGETAPPPEGDESSEPAPAPLDPEPSPPSDPRPVRPAPPAVALLLADGRTVRGPLLSEDALAFLLQDTRGFPLRIPKENVRQKDGAPFEPDWEAWFRARLSRASDPVLLEELGRWCRERGRSADLARVAERLLSMDPGNELALAWTGRFRYRGRVRTRAELEALGALRGDRMVGSPRDRRELVRLWHLTVGAPPGAEEFTEALRSTTDEICDRLIRDPRTWHALLEEEAAELGVPWSPLLDEVLAAGAERLAAGTEPFTVSWQELFTSPALRATHPRAAEAVAALFRTALGLRPGDDPELFQAAARMWQGERVAVFGERGRSPEEFAGILLRQPAFFRRLLQRLLRRCGGEAPDEREVARQSFVLGADATRLDEIVRGWLPRGLLAAGENPPLRAKNAAQIAAGLYQVLYGRPGTANERGEAAAFLENLGDLGLGTGILARRLAARAPEPAVLRDQEAGWLEERFLEILGRAPTEAERTAARALLEQPQGRRALLASLLSAPAWRTW